MTYLVLRPRNFRALGVLVLLTSFVVAADEIDNLNLCKELPDGIRKVGDTFISVVHHPSRSSDARSIRTSMKIAEAIATVNLAQFIERSLDASESVVINDVDGSATIVTKAITGDGEEEVITRYESEVVSETISQKVSMVMRGLTRIADRFDPTVKEVCVAIAVNPASASDGSNLEELFNSPKVKLAKEKEITTPKAFSRQNPIWK